MAISLALLGSGASGVAVHLAGDRLDRRRTGAWLSSFAVVFAASTVAALVVVLGSGFSPVDPPLVLFARLSVLYVAAAVPFFFAGAAVSLAVARGARDMSRLYLYDLGGAAAGCLLLIPLLDHVGAPNAVLVVSLLAAAAAFVFASAEPVSRPHRLLAVLALVGAGGLLAANVATGALDVRHAKGLPEAGNVIFSKWNSFSRVTVWGSLSDTSVLVMIDADAGTLLLRDAGEWERHPWLAGRLESLVYRLRPGGRVLVIGAGAGLDVASARLLAAREVTAVEVNPAIARDIMSSEPFLTYSGRLYERPGVRLVVDEARSFLRSERAAYDVIQATMVDTWAATAAGAFSLTENNLYTVEAFCDFLRRLAPDGVLSVTRWYVEPPDQVLRLASLARAAGRALGLEPVADRVIVVRGAPEEGRERAPATFLLKRSPFTPAEVEAAEAIAASQGFTVLFSPATRPPGELTRLLEEPRPESVWSASERDLSPPPDNRPFFFHTVRLSHLASALAADPEARKTNLGTLVLVALLVLTSLLVSAFIFLPLGLARWRAPVPEPLSPALFGFAGLGTGYVLVEVALVQKCILFLGSPAYALSVVLLSLLAFGALGARSTARVPDEALGSAVRRALLAAATAAVVAVLAVSPTFDALAHWHRPLRVAAAIGVLAPVGFLLGRPLPLAVRGLARESPAVVAWAWGVNGAASVLGSVLALVLALAFGLDQALLAGGALYAGTFAVLGGKRL
jgi:predicted membrane-bound spermidine synthase